MARYSAYSNVVSATTKYFFEVDGNTFAWYDSQYTPSVTKDVNDHVSRWNDKLGSGNDLVTVAGTPHWSTSGILFNGTSDGLKTASKTLNQPTFIYAVIKQVTWTSSDYLWDGISGANSGALLQLSTTPGLKAGAGSFSAQNNNLALDTLSIVRLLFNGASSKLQINNTSATTGNFGANNMGGFALGANLNLNGAWSNILVCDIIIRRVADSSGDETKIYNYLATKNGLPTI